MKHISVGASAALMRLARQTLKLNGLELGRFQWWRRTTAATGGRGALCPGLTCGSFATKRCTALVR